MQAVETFRTTQTPVGQAAPTKFRMDAAESQEYLRLQKSGKTPQEAQELIEAQRLLTKSMKTPTVKQARTKVAERNATGRWPDTK
jgi:hypothetical protein